MSDVATSEPVWEHFPVGRTFRSDAVTITETHVVTWASLTGDWVPLHMDAEYASRTAFGQRIAHGPLTLSMALGLVVRSGVFGQSVLAWLGLDELRLPLPVMFGDTVHARVVVEQARETSKPDRGLAVLRYGVVNQREETVMTFLSSFLLKRAG